MTVEKILLSKEIVITTSVQYLSQESRPDESLFVFAYHIRIENLGQSPIKLVSRHWVITNSRNEVEEVQGAGVVGLQPTIEPEGVFEYDSLCPMTTSTGSMRGSYFFVCDDGTRLTQEIPEFFLVAPQSLH